MRSLRADVLADDAESRADEDLIAPGRVTLTSRLARTPSADDIADRVVQRLARGSAPPPAAEPTPAAAPRDAAGGDDFLIAHEVPAPVLQRTARDALPYPGIDVVLEQIAHRFAYHDPLSDEDQATLTSWGYQPMSPIHLPGDLQLMTLRPAPGHRELSPVMAFRGSFEVQDFIEDANGTGVGMFQFSRNEAVIVQKLQVLGGGVILTGHSLGGALAQITAAMHPELVSSVVTFQAPGIDQALVDRMHASEGGRRIERASRHHVVDDCIVSRAGEAHTGGEVIMHHTPAWVGLLPAHQSLPLAEEAASAGTPASEDGGFDEGAPRIDFSAPTGHAEDPSSGVVEGGRHLLGFAARHDQEAYVAVWTLVRAGAESGRVRYEELVATIITASPLTADGMRQNLDQLFPELRVASGLEDRVRDGTITSADAFAAAVAEQVRLDDVRGARMRSYYQAILRDVGIAEDIGRATGPMAPMRKARGTEGLPDDAHAIAARGAAGGGGTIPHGDAIQAAFGRHDVGGVRAHQGGGASAAAEALGARAYAYGNDVVFDGAPDLHTAAHEAAHVVQQRGGVQLAGGVGAEGDAHERHADAVADRVVRGESAEDLLDEYGGGGGAAAIQRIPEPADAPGIPGVTGARETSVQIPLELWFGSLEIEFRIRGEIEALADEHERVTVTDRGPRGTAAQAVSTGRLRDLLAPDCRDLQDRFAFSMEPGQMRGEIGVETRTFHLGPVELQFGFDLIDVEAGAEGTHVRFATTTAEAAGVLLQAGPGQLRWELEAELQPNFTAIYEAALPYVVEAGEPGLAATEAALAESGAAGAAAGATAAVGLSLLWMGFVLDDLRESSEEGHREGLATWYVSAYAQCLAARVFEGEAPQYEDPSHAADRRGVLRAQRRGRDDARTTLATLDAAQRAELRRKYRTRERLAEALARHVAGELDIPYDASAER